MLGGGKYPAAIRPLARPQPTCRRQKAENILQSGMQMNLRRKGCMALPGYPPCTTTPSDGACTPYSEYRPIGRRSIYSCSCMSLVVKCVDRRSDNTRQCISQTSCKRCWPNVDEHAGKCAVNKVSYPHKADCAAAAAAAAFFEHEHGGRHSTTLGPSLAAVLQLRLQPVTAGAQTCT